MKSTASNVNRLTHLLSGLEVGGKERVVIDLARRARKEGLDHRLLLYDTPFRNCELDFDPGNIPCDFIPRGAGLDLSFARKIRRKLIESGTEVVHAHNDTAIFYAALASFVGYRRGFSLVGTFHTLPGYDTPRARKLTYWASQRAKAITAVSDDLSHRLTKLGWSRRPDILWNGIDLSIYLPLAPHLEKHRSHWHQELFVKRDDFLVGLIGRHDLIKRQIDLIEAGLLLRSQGIPLVLVLVGEGPMRVELEASYNFSWLHFVKRIEDIPQFLQSLDAFVLCSDHECAPRALLEAMACGCACVATHVGGIPSIATSDTSVNHPAIMTTPARDPVALADALAILFNNKIVRNQFSQAGRQCVEKNFSSEQEWQAYTNIWNTAAARS